jgi:hypothetical protein
MTHRLAIALVAAALLVVAGCEGSGSAKTQAVGNAAQEGPGLSTDPVEAALVEVAKPEPVKAKAPDDRLLDKTFDDLKFDIEPDAPFFRTMLTPEIEALADRSVRIRGYILPTAQSRGIKQFVLVRDNMECCFGPGAALYDCVLVEMAPGKSTEFSIRPVTVTGRFVIDPFPGPGGRTLAVFRMTGEQVE